ncbi:5431_t:CDS:2, partial [Ambispora leptoticha]
HMIPINTKNTPSTSKDSNRVYYFSLIEHIQRMLKNPSISSHLYFGPGILSKSCEELWEGDLWAESPLFGQSNLITMQGSFNCGDFVKYYSVTKTVEVGRIRSFVIVDKKVMTRIQRLFSYDQIPQYLHSKKNIPCSPKERYLVEESELFIIDPSSLICYLNVWLQDQPAPPIVDFFVTKILYYYNGRWKFRPIKLRHQHPSERISVKPPADLNMPIFKFYLDLYYDDFGTFRNTYHSLGGVYLQIGNMPRQLRKQLRNHFIIGLVPFGGNLKDFIKIFIKEVHQLEQGFVMNVNGVDCWISGGLAMVTADLPQGNDIAGVLRHNANLGCRSCKASKNELTNISFDIYSNGRYHQITNQEFEIINAQQTKSARLQTCSQYGLRPSPGP